MKNRRQFKIDTLTQINDHSLSWLCTDTSIKKKSFIGPKSIWKVIVLYGRQHIALKGLTEEKSNFVALVNLGQKPIWS